MDHGHRCGAPTGWRAAGVIARTAISPRLAASSIRAILQQLDPALPVDIQTMHQHVTAIVRRPRFYAILLGAFAALGVPIAAVGLFGMMSFLVAQRSREIGVRVALGATRAHILRLTLGAAARWTAAGIVTGAIAAIVVLCTVALAAAAAPARLDPMETLRHE
jgi:ABC-type antimicrobial peptide transport system permease subunit